MNKPIPTFIGKVASGRFGLPIGAGLVATAVMMTNGGAAHAGDPSAFPRINRLFNRIKKGDKISDMSPAEQQAIKSFGNYSMDTAPTPRLKAAESMLDKAVAAGGITVKGNATITVNVDSTDSKGNTTRKSSKVPLPLFGQFTPPAPQTGGKPKTARK
jgi:hypothetical protein